MSARDHILHRVAAARRESKPVDRWSISSASGELVARFSQALTAAKGEVFVSEDLEGAWEILGSILAQLGAQRVVYNQEPPLDGATIRAQFPKYDWTTPGGKNLDFKQVCVEADAGITGAVFGLAETGTIGIVSSHRSSRLVSLLPDVHVALLDKKDLIPDLMAWERIRPRKMPAQLVLISGPSKTADIEQTLVVGAHGPKRLMVIIYGS